MCKLKSGSLLSHWLIAIFLPLNFFLATHTFASADEPSGRIALIGADPTADIEQGVPSWRGGLPVQERTHRHHEDPYANETPMFIISANNINEHARFLTAGLIKMLETYPDTFYIPVYPSHRSTTYPAWIYERMQAGATAKLIANGNGLENAIPGVNFPEPRNGLEAIWNHITRWRGQYVERVYSDAIVYSNGEKRVVRSRQQVAFELFRRLQPANASKQVLVYYSSTILEPSRLAGGAFLAIDFVNQHRFPRKTWSYDAGQRRIKRLPNIDYDNAAILAESLRTVDDTDMFNGSPDRFNWVLRGKEVKYIPYNNYRASSPEVTYNDLLTPFHPNPEHLRFEAHRVWVIDALLKPSAYHIYTKRTYYIDEDSWSIEAADQYDHEGKIWRIGLALLKHYYEVPLTFSAGDYFHDLKTQHYHAGGLTNEEVSSGEYSEQFPAPSYFTPSALRARVKR